MVYVDKSDYRCCWQQTVTTVINNVVRQLRLGDSQLPPPVAEFIPAASEWIEYEKGLPSTIFKNLWWNKNIIDKRPASLSVVDKLGATSKDVVIKAVGRWAQIKCGDEPRILLHYPHSDHGFHSLFHALTPSVQRQIFAFVNNSRTRLGSQENITWDDIQAKIMACGRCKLAHFASGLSCQAIYYAPPGAGKTTALNNEPLVGLDTDWIGCGLTWKDYAVILSHGIPIITNQPENFIGCGLKIIGIYSSNIREDPYGVSFTTCDAVEQFNTRSGTASVIWRIPDNEYVSNFAIGMEALALMFKIIRSYALNMHPYYLRLSKR